MGVWNCPDCDYKNSDSSKTCASCGASRPGAYRVNASATTWKCPKCNTSNSTNVSKCFRCGASRYGDTVRTQHEEPEERKGFQVNSKVAAVCIAVAVVVAVGSAINRASTSRPSVQSSTTSVTTEATTKQEKKNSASKPSSSSKPSVLIKYAADENNISVDDISETEATENPRPALEHRTGSRICKIHTQSKYILPYPPENVKEEFFMPRPKKQAPNHADGMYEYKATVGKSFDGRSIRKSFYSSKSLADAKVKAQEYIISKETALRTGEVFIQKNYTFAEWALKWLEVYKRPTVTENTFITTYQIPVKNHLIPYFGKAELQDIKNVDIRNFFSQKQRTASASLLHKLKITLSAIFEAAIENDLCVKNPAKNIEYRSAVEKNEKKVYSDEQIRQAKDFFFNDMPEAFLLLDTGLRRGEMLGLMWKDINIENKTLSVNRSIADKKGGGIAIMPPKWESYRTIPISEELIRLLETLPHNSMYVFPNVNGQIACPHNWSQKLKRHMAALNAQYPSIPVLTAHELRHTRGTELRRSGVDIYTIQKLMGHRDVNVTANIYVHDDTETTRRAAKIV